MMTLSTQQTINEAVVSLIKSIIDNIFVYKMFVLYTSLEFSSYFNLKNCKYSNNIFKY